MTETAFHTGEENTPRLAEAFAADPWTGENIQLFNMLDRPVMESGGGGLVSTTMDYARFCQMLLNGGTLEGTRIIGRKDAAIDGVQPSRSRRQSRLPADAGGHGFGLGFAVRTDQGIAPFPGSVGNFSGAALPARSSGSIRRKSCSPCSCRRARASVNISARWCGVSCTPRWSEEFHASNSNRVCRPGERRDP
ncbi:MAG: serine hydrolase [Bradyrhizobium sp.]